MVIENLNLYFHLLVLWDLFRGLNISSSGGKTKDTSSRISCSPSSKLFDSSDTDGEKETKKNKLNSTWGMTKPNLSSGSLKFLNCSLTHYPSNLSLLFLLLSCGQMIEREELILRKGWTEERREADQLFDKRWKEMVI
jgi:hypothetical protein